MIVLQDIYFIVGVLGGIASFIYFIWNTSKKFTTIELNAEQTKIEYVKDLARIQEQHLNDVKALESEIQRQVIERRDDINESQIRLKDEFINIQKQIDSTKADVKSLLSKIEVNDTKLKQSDEIHTELKEEIATLCEHMTNMVNDQLSFVTKWNQRIEDRIENLRAEYLRMLTTFHAPVDKNG